MNASAVNSVFEWLQQQAAAFPRKPFVESFEQSKPVTYFELDLLTNRFCHYLKSRNVRANERVVLLCGNCLEHMVVFLGVLKYGATICTINTDMNRAHLPEILSALSARVVVFDDTIGVDGIASGVYGEPAPIGEWHASGGTGLFAKLENCPATPVEPVNGPHDDALIVYTSGTTSRPKGSISDYKRLATNAESVAEGFGLTSEDRILEFRSLNWLSPLVSSALAPLFTGATVVLARKFSESRYFDWLLQYHATIGIGNPTCIAMLLNRPVAVQRAALSSLRFITSSSAALPVEHWKAFEQMYQVPVAQGYGATEALWIACSNERTRRIGSVGRPFATHKLAIVDPDGNVLPHGQIGEVEVGGDPETHYRYVRHDGVVETTAIGRLRPGDIGYLDEDGFLFLTGRSRELIVRGGVNISPAELDNFLLQIPGVGEAAAFGVPDKIYGEEVVAYVVPKAGMQITSEQILDQLRTKLPPYKLPKQMFFRSSLPKSDRGKLDRKALTEQWKREHDAV
jgi:acyl-CoA synthetase (AMP-forming)/AMP-acid ligase II